MEIVETIYIPYLEIKVFCFIFLFVFIYLGSFHSIGAGSLEDLSNGLKVGSFLLFLF